LKIAGPAISPIRGSTTDAQTASVDTSGTRRAELRDRPATGVARLWCRQYYRYPSNQARALNLVIVVLVTIVLYYELYIQGAVATKIIADYGMTLRFFILISVIGNAIGALGSLAAGLADRWGRANLVVGGQLVSALLVLFGLPNAPNENAFAAIFAVVSLVEGTVLVATPALIRDFSPQLGRASAMGFWTLGPVMGSLVVTEVSSHTLDSHPDWQFQFRLCGAVGLVVFVIALVGLRELSARLRDQMMVSLHDRALIEARAAGIDPEAAVRGSWRQMIRADIVGPAFAISTFLLFYYFAVGFFVIYYAINFGYDEAKANNLANWYWITNAIALVVTGVISDRLRVRKPFMVIGALISAAGVAVFAQLTTHPSTSYHTFAWVLVVISAGGGIAYCAWMAAFTETVEKHNPAATATGLAVWGGILRVVVCVSLVGLIFAVSSASVLVDHGAKVQALATRYGPQLAVNARLSPTTSAALSASPNDPQVQYTAISDLTGLSVFQVSHLAEISTEYATEIATLQSIDPATLGILATNPQDSAAINKAVGEIEKKFGVDAKTAGNRLFATSALAPSDLAALQNDGPKVQAAAAQLKTLATIAPADAAYLAANAAHVQQAQHDSPGQWQRWWWIAFGGQIVFLPFIFLMTGRWSSRRARADALAHAQAVDRELEALRIPRDSDRAGDRAGV
jgi:MFS transporter, ACS family, D-galactonate transporter